MLHLRFGIRLKLLLLSLFLFAIPWLGYQYVWELEAYLRLGQEQTLVGTARAVATALHERPALFDKQASYLADVKPGTDLYAHRIVDPIRLDGRLQDWLDYRHLAAQYDQRYLLEEVDEYRHDDLHFEHMVGIYGGYLYAYFKVVDDVPLLRGKNSLRIDRNDHLYIAFTNPEGKFQRYLIATRESGWVNAFRLGQNAESLLPQGMEFAIQGNWQMTPEGYNVELRIPLVMLADKIAFAIGDVDEVGGKTQFRIGTANPEQVSSLGTVLVPSPEIENIVKGLEYSNARIWVLDKHRRVMARSGSIIEATGIADRNLRLVSKTPKWWQYIETNWLLPLYYRILTQPPAQFMDELQDAFALKGQDIERALQGTPDTLWRLTPDNKAVVLSAAHPIWIDNTVMGAVVVEQTTHGIRTLRNQALEKLFNVILAVMVLGTLALFLFASRISFRIRRLRNQTEAAIDSNGKILSNVPLSRTQDEIGDLSRTFHQVLDRLSQYTAYLENMASRLSHELRTPIAIVKSSIENMELADPEQAKNPYLARAQEGTKRLSLILNNMSEASRLEHAVRNAEFEGFLLDELLASCIHGYQLAYPERHFVLQSDCESLNLSGAPDLLVQMLDKITNNAVDFSPKGSDICFNLSLQQGRPRLTIHNQGPALPEDMQQQLFSSMVSVRAPSASDTPHLGLGLFIAKTIADFHKADISISNTDDGVEVRVLFAALG